MIERPWRCFWAVPLPAELRSRLVDTVAEMRSDPGANADWRWADPDGWHVTLAFLGGVPADAVPLLLQAVADAVRDVGPFSVEAGGLGGFPSGRNPRVLWYGVSDPDRRLRSLARLVRDASRLVDPGPFRAHVTLARSRNRLGAQPPAALPGGMPIGSVDVRSITLFRSHRGRGPARYEAIGDAPLIAEVPAAGVPAG